MINKRNTWFCKTLLASCNPMCTFLKQNRIMYVATKKHGGHADDTIRKLFSKNSRKFTIIKITYIVLSIIDNF